MAKEQLIISGTENKKYDLDEISEDSRENSEKALIVQVHTYKKGENPNPTNLKIGQIWMSKKVK